MTIMSIINGKTSIYDLLVDAYAQQHFQRGYYITRLMVKSKVDLNHFISYLAKKRTNNQNALIKIEIISFTEIVLQFSYGKVK